MDQTLLTKEEKRWVLTWDAFVEELRRVSCLAAPMVVVSVTLYLLQVVSVIMAGHLSELSLSGVSMATSFTNVTGFSLLECVRRRVMKSVIANPYCSEAAAKDAMEAVWDVCYNDTRPFDRAP